MKETKKEYQHPEIVVIEVDSTEILVTSPGDPEGEVPPTGPIGF